ncbi:hypothetical protein [Dysosmobacter welbionis]|uniref:hypothetical protein n=1 Tax=Dysosmobacter welbionis TaxID=2093857 RepID=UPI002109C4BF|nr:hypothetical protein [Dysosmobacter welbionis]MCQ5045650.1 hypothetical protein [Dysosmobacter welbionis]
MLKFPWSCIPKYGSGRLESGETLSRYMTALITKYYEMGENVKMDKDNVRTVAFQVPTELFEQLKAYLKRNGIKQNAFFLDCIRQALAEDVGTAEE